MSKTIVKAAIKIKDEIIAGYDHGECFSRANFPIPTQDLEQGFIDSNGNFVDRKQAMIIAKEAGQLRYTPHKETLISEDLHLDWLNKQASKINELEKTNKRLKKNWELSRGQQRRLYNDLKLQLIELNEKFLSLVNKYGKSEYENDQLKHQLAEKEKMHLINENEWQNYCAFKHIEPQIKGCLDREREHEKQLTNLSIEQLEDKKEKLYFELLFTRLQWIHKKADECREEKERFGGIKDMALDSVWRVLDLQKHECCNYEEMIELEEGIQAIAEDKLLRDIEHDLGVKVTRTENEIFNEIELINDQIKQSQSK